MIVVVAPSTLVRNNGTRVNINALETSVSRLTIPRKNTFKLSPIVLRRFRLS